MQESESMPCRYCEGTGVVAVNRCAEIVNGRRCKHLVRKNQQYYELYPDREYARPYCERHGNMRVTQRLYGGAVIGM